MEQSQTLGQICRLEFIFILSDIQLAVIVRFRAVVRPCHSRNSPGTRQTYKSCRGCLFASLDRKTANSSQRGAPPYERKEKKPLLPHETSATLSQPNDIIHHVWFFFCLGMVQSLGLICKRAEKSPAWWGWGTTDRGEVKSERSHFKVAPFTLSHLGLWGGHGW